MFSTYYPHPSGIGISIFFVAPGGYQGTLYIKEDDYELFNAIGRRTEKLLDLCCFLLKLAECLSVSSPTYYNMLFDKEFLLILRLIS